MSVVTHQCQPDRQRGYQVDVGDVDEELEVVKGEFAERPDLGVIGILGMGEGRFDQRRPRIDEEVQSVLVNEVHPSAVHSRQGENGRFVHGDGAVDWQGCLGCGGLFEVVEARVGPQKHPPVGAEFAPRDVGVECPRAAVFEREFAGFGGLGRSPADGCAGEPQRRGDGSEGGGGEKRASRNHPDLQLDLKMQRYRWHCPQVLRKSHATEITITCLLTSQ